MFNKLILMGILIGLLGCNNKVAIDPDKSKHYVRDTKTNEVYYKYSLGGSLRPSFSYIARNPNDIVVLGEYYATDGHRVFYTDLTIKGANPKGFSVHPVFQLFAEDRISNIYFYKNEPLSLDYHSTKIHSNKYVSDKNKVLYDDGDLNKDKSFDLEVDVQDALSFELVPYIYPDSSLSRYQNQIAKDKFWYYFNAVRLPLSSNKPLQIMNLGWPSLMLYQDNLHYFKFHETYFNAKIPSELTMDYDGKLTDGREFYDHYIIRGFKQVQQINASNWLKDNNGLYYVSYNLEGLLKVSNKQYNTYEIHPVYTQNYIRTENKLFAVYGLGKKVEFSASAEILSEDIVKDKQTIYYKGDKVEDVDVATVVKFERSFIDKNYYYFSIRPNENRLPIPHWAYDELINGNLKFEDLKNIELKYLHQVHTHYWNGFLVKMEVPSKNNPDKTLNITLKNIEQKTLHLNRPLEEELILFYRKEDLNVLSEPIRPTSPYNYQEIEPERTISFSTELPSEITDKNGNTFTFPYFISLSSVNQPTPDKTNYNDLYLEQIVDVK